jgi:hypothetical protein
MDFAGDHRDGQPSRGQLFSVFEGLTRRSVPDSALLRPSRRGPAGGPSASNRLGDLGVMAALFGCGVLSAIVFASWRRDPFDTLDFSEFLPQLQQVSGFWSQWGRLALYYASQGRVAEVVYGFIAANYHFFGLDPLGWQVTRSLLMLLLPPAAYLVLRRFGAGRLASLIGASVYSVGAIPAAGWLRLTGEPLGALFLLGATALAHGWSDSRQGLRRILMLALCLVGMLFSKETLVACLPFLCVVATFWSGDNLLRPPRVPRASLQFWETCIVCCLLLGAVFLWAASLQRSDAYAALYGASALSTRSIATRAFGTALPVFYYTDLWRLLIFPPNLVFLACLAIGLAGLIRPRVANRTVKRKLLVSALLPLAGLLVYLPWPRFEPFYAIPFLFGLALAIAVLVDATALSLRSRLVLILCWLFVLAGSALNAIGLARYTSAHRHLNHEIARHIALYGPADTIVVVSTDLTVQAWQNPAATLGRYARAVGLTTELPTLLDLECRTDLRPERSSDKPRYVEFIFVGPCGTTPKASRGIERSFTYFDWATLTFERAAERVAIVEPSR